MAAIFTSLIAGEGSAQGTPAEYELKAALLFKFTLFVEWPDEKLPKERTPFLIGVLGEDPFESLLDKTVAGKKTKGKKVKVKRSKEPEDLLDCHVVFISSSEDKRLAKILPLFRDSHVLSVGEMRGFAERGGIINLIKVAEMIRFEINNEAASEAHLKISSQLLKIAKIVSSADDKEG